MSIFPHHLHFLFSSQWGVFPFKTNSINCCSSITLLYCLLSASLVSSSKKFSPLKPYCVFLSSYKGIQINFNDKKKNDTPLTLSHSVYLPNYYTIYPNRSTEFTTCISAPFTSSPNWNMTCNKAFLLNRA